jgi:hypothetical protein
MDDDRPKFNLLSQQGGFSAIAPNSFFNNMLCYFALHDTSVGIGPGNGKSEVNIRDFVPRATRFGAQGEAYIELLAHTIVFESIDLYAISWGIPRRPA